MSEYAQMKARALEAQRAREREIQLEIEVKAEHAKRLRQEEDELRKRREAASREARTLELKRANEAMNMGKQTVAGEDYNPFAEEERRATPSAPSKAGVEKAKHAVHAQAKRPGITKSDSGRQTKLGQGQDIPRPPLSNKKSASGSKPRAKKTDKEISPPPLGRKEQAARALMQSAKKSAGTSIFSSRLQIAPNGHARVQVPSSSSSPGSALHASQASSSRLPPAAKGTGRPGSGPGSGSGSGNGRKGKGPAAVADLRPLCPDRTSRDQRTIDEIQRDIKARKNVTVPSTGGAKSTSSQGHDRRLQSTLKSQSSNGPNGSNGRTTTTSGNIKRPAARRRSLSVSSASTTSSDDSSRPSRKKSRSVKSPNGNGKSDISSMIQDLFRRPGRPPLPTGTRYDSDSGSGSDMEAGLSDVEEEERRAIRIARREDELAEKEERERREKKEKLRKEREKGMVK